MQLTIVLRKEVPDAAAAQVLLDIVKAKLADHPDIDVNGSVSERLEIIQ